VQPWALRRFTCALREIKLSRCVLVAQFVTVGFRKLDPKRAQHNPGDTQRNEQYFDNEPVEPGVVNNREYEEKNDEYYADQKGVTKRRQERDAQLVRAGVVTRVTLQLIDEGYKFFFFHAISRPAREN